MQIIQNCNILIVKILREMLDKMKQKKINQVAELILLIIKQRVLHLRREINTKLLLTTINIFLIMNHIIEMQKIKMTKKIFNKNEYNIEHLRLRKIVKKIMMRDESEKKRRMKIQMMKKMMKKMQIQNKKKCRKRLRSKKKQKKICQEI